MSTNNFFTNSPCSRDDAFGNRRCIIKVSINFQRDASDGDGKLGVILKCDIRIKNFVVTTKF